jgi:hypothetical protein
MPYKDKTGQCPKCDEKHKRLMEQMSKPIPQKPQESRKLKLKNLGSN